MTVTFGEIVDRHRQEMVGVAYRMLGSVADAEDVVQEAFIRLERQGVEGIERPGAWLHRVTSRLCLDRLGSAQRRREVYVGPWLPEPLVQGPDAAEPVELAESVTMAFLVVLEALSPAERVAFILRDVFGHTYDDLAATLERSPEACRQLVSRARAHISDRRPRFQSDARTRADVAGRFLAACGSGEMSELIAVLSDEVVLLSDGGGNVSAARRPVHGPERVARFLIGVLGQVPAGTSFELGLVNGTLGAIGRRSDGTVDVAVAVDVVDDRVAAVNLVRNPDKLAHLVGQP